VSYKLWVARICMVLTVFLLFIASSYVFRRWMTTAALTLSMHWELFGLCMLPQIIAGVLLGISPEVFFNLRNVRFSPIKFIVLAIIPIIVLVYLVGRIGRYWTFPLLPLPDYIIDSYIHENFALITSSVWLGVAIGKAFHIRQ